MYPILDALTRHSLHELLDQGPLTWCGGKDLTCRMLSDVNDAGNEFSRDNVCRAVPVTSTELDCRVSVYRKLWCHIPSFPVPTAMHGGIILHVALKRLLGERSAVRKQNGTKDRS